MNSIVLAVFNWLLSLGVRWLSVISFAHVIIRIFGYIDFVCNYYLSVHICRPFFSFFFIKMREYFTVLYLYIILYTHTNSSEDRNEHEKQGFFDRLRGTKGLWIFLFLFWYRRIIFMFSISLSFVIFAQEVSLDLGMRCRRIVFIISVGDN